MAQKPYFCAYHSYLGSIATLNDAERGRLFTACLTYSLRGEEIELRGNEKHVWPIMKWQIDRDKEKYDAYCQKMRANGALGGSAPKNQKKSKWYQMVPEGTIEKEKEKERRKTGFRVSFPQGFPQSFPQHHLLRKPSPPSPRRGSLFLSFLLMILDAAWRRMRALMRRRMRRRARRRRACCGSCGTKLEGRRRMASGMIRLFAYQCPYFVADYTAKGGKTFAIRCECGSCVILPDRRSACEHAKTFCASAQGWRDCPTARALESYYERTGKHDET